MIEKKKSPLTGEFCSTEEDRTAPFKHLYLNTHGIRGTHAPFLTMATTAAASAAAAAAASSSTAAPITTIVDRKNLVTYIGNRVRVTLDDDSVLTGRLVSLSISGNLVLTDVERQRLLKRRRSRDGAHETSRECYAAVLFVRGGCVVSVSYDSGITTDKSVIDHIGGREANSSRLVQMANAAPSTRPRHH